MLESECHMSRWSQLTLADTRHAMGAWVSLLSIHLVGSQLTLFTVVDLFIVSMYFFLSGGDKGSGSEWYSDAGALVQKSISYRKPVIVVSIKCVFVKLHCSVVNFWLSSFRLGLLGFATNPIIRDDNILAGEEGTGNYGMHIRPNFFLRFNSRLGLRDQRKAQEWVHRFINEFGGDPANVTLFGSGSGGADIICHLLSRANQTQPMFHRAIVQSAVFEPTLPDVSSAGWHLSRVMSALQVSSMEKFRLVPTAKLLGLGHTIRAVDDGVFFRDGWQGYFRSESAHSHHHHLEASKPIGRSSYFRASGGSSKSRSHSRSTLLSPTKTTTFKGDQSMQPLIIGDCSSDSLLWSMPISLWTSAGVVRRLKAICQSLSKTNAILRVYDINSFTPDDEIMDHVLELVNDARVAWPTQCVADSAKRERGGKGVWRFVFDQEGPTRCLPHHAADLMYLFDNIRLPENAFTTADMDPYFEGPYDLDHEDEDMHCVSVGNSNPGDVGVGEYIFSSDSLLEKCESLTRGRQGYGHNGNVGSAHTHQDDDEWMTTAVDEYSYARVRDAIQERWISFAHGEAPWREDKVFVFGPEGETGERSMEIFDGRRRKKMWKEALEPLGFTLVQKFGVELSRGPALGADRIRI